MNRTEKNWISFGCGTAYVLCYLFLPFYRAVIVPITGMTLMNYTSAIMVVPLVLGFLMMLSPLLLDARISVYIGGGSLLVTLILLFFGSAMIAGGGISGAAFNTASDLSGMNLGTLLSGVITPCVGGILCLLLCAGHLVFELTQGNRKPVVVREEDDFFS
jgi:hypothetical protein